MKAEVMTGGIVTLLMVPAICGVVWFAGSSNPATPAGYVGYVTQGAVFGSDRFLVTQSGPTSYGRTWMTSVVNVSVTPYTYDEPFDDATAILSKDSVKVRFAVHVLWKVRNDKESVQMFVEKFTTMRAGDKSDVIVKAAYDNFLKEPVRTSARNELQQFEALEIKDNIVEIGKTVEKQIKELCKDSPFEIIQIVVGNIQYPEAVANAVSRKMASTQKLEQAEIEIAIAKKEAEKKIAEAEGISKSMEIVQQKLTGMYLQHEAIEAQKAMVGSPNHTTIYIPVGPMGVPLVQTLPVDSVK